MSKFIGVLTLASAILWGGGNDDLAVVVNKGTSTSNLTKSQLRKLVLGEQDSWPSGEPVTVILNSPGTVERGSVLRLICRMTEQDYYQHLVHANANSEATAQHKPNKSRVIADSPATVRKLVSTIPGALAFLRFSEVNDSVKVVSVDGVAAGEADYKMKAGK